MADLRVFTSVREAAQEERRWVAKVRQGDESAMNMLLTKHRRRILRAAANVLRDSHEAEDVAQEAFLKAFREIHRLRDDKAFGGYLYKICVRLCMDRLRSRKPEPSMIERTEPSQGSQIETRVLVEKLLRKLSPDLRLTLVLREMEQLSYDEVAEAMDVPVGTVRSRLHSARAKFRELWQEATQES